MLEVQEVSWLNNLDLVGLIKLIYGVPVFFALLPENVGQGSLLGLDMLVVDDASKLLVSHGARVVEQSDRVL